jgi:peroxiredoxin
MDFPLPPDLPRPIDDGAADHLRGVPVPRVALRSTAGRMIELCDRPAARTVVYCYPRTGVPGEALPKNWDAIPGARGCTPQSCGFRDHYGELAAAGAEVFGLSTQPTDYQKEMATRLNLPFEILSDARYELCDALHLPTFEVEGVRLLKRLTFVVRDRRIEHVFYPVFPPDKSAGQTLHWFREHPI